MFKIQSSFIFNLFEGFNSFMTDLIPNRNLRHLVYGVICIFIIWLISFIFREEPKKYYYKSR